MDEINAISSEQVAQLRSNFHEKVISKSPDFHPKDMERVKANDLWLRRFIAHCESDLEAALTMLYDCCQWRKEFGTNDLNETHLQTQLLDEGTLFIRNEDKWGKRLLVFKGKNHQRGSIETETMQKFVVYFFERIERESNSDQISIIFDMKDTGWNNMDMDFVRYLITLLKTYYPYFVNYLIIYEMPWLLNAAWRVIRTWLSEKFASRVKLLKKETLKDYIDPSNQLVEWGGTDNYVYTFEPELKTTKETEGTPLTHVPNGVVLPPNARPRKLQFSAVDHHQSADICTSTSPITTPMLPSIPETANCLAEVQDRLIFKPSEGESEELRAELKIKNLSLETLAIKIKTTSPDKYRVKPIICIVTRSSEATVSITTNVGVSACSLTRDRFQVQVVEVPSSTTAESPDLGGLFKSIVATGAGVVETYRIGVSLVAKPGDTGTPSISLNDERLRRGLEDLERRIAEAVSEKLAVHNAKLERQCLTGMGILVFLFAVVLLYLFSLSRNYPVDCSKVATGKVCKECVKISSSMQMRRTYFIGTDLLVKKLYPHIMTVLCTRLKTGTERLSRLSSFQNKIQDNLFFKVKTDAELLQPEVKQLWKCWNEIQGKS